MNDVIVVVNAGSSSLKFSLFVQASKGLELVARGQAEGLYTSPRFVAKDGAGDVIEEKTWGEGIELGHAGAPVWAIGWFMGGWSTRSQCGSTHR